MLRSAIDLTGYKVYATDGPIGNIVECFFDDSNWIIRYVIIHTGNWLSGKEVLISPYAIMDLNWSKQVVSVNLTRSQIESCPDVDTQKPLSREFEAKYFQHYRWPFYWTGAGIWGTAAVPEAIVDFPWTGLEEENQNSRLNEQTGAPKNHLRSTTEVRGYHIQALDARIGHVDDFLFNDDSWAIEYLVIKTRNWLLGRSVLLRPDDVDWLDWTNERLHIHLSKDQIEHSRRFAA